MSFMFYGCSSYNQALPSSFNTAAVTNMYAMFYGCSAYNQALPSSFNTAAVTDMSYMFLDCSAFNQALPSSFNTAKVTDMSYMFDRCSAYNQALPSSFNTAAVTNMSSMFGGCSAYNQSLPSSFNTAAVTDMSYMFLDCSAFNQALPSSFNTAAVTDMGGMFYDASKFNQNIGNLNIANVTDMTNIFNNSGISRTNYDNILMAWNTAGYTNKNLGNASPLQYCAGQTARTSLTTTKGWTITGDTYNCPPPFITRWNLATAGSGATQLSFGVATSGTVNYTWTTVPAGTSGAGTFTGTTATITGLPAGATIDLSISPTNFQRININSGTDKSRLTAINQWGDVVWTSMSNAFAGCNNMVLNATDVPNTAAVTDMSYMFLGCSSFNQALPNGFNTAAVTNMNTMFYNCSSYNQALPSSFNTTSVTNMSSMFAGCSAYNQSLPSSFNTAAVTNMSSMFQGCSAFNQSLPSSFNTAAVTNMSGMFNNCSVFNQSLPSSFNTTKVTNMSAMFYGCSAYNQSLPSSFNTAAVTNMSGMFNNCSVFNQSLPSSFNTAAVTNMSSMFSGCSAYNQALPANLNTAAVTNMNAMFANCSAYNQALPANLNTAAVTNMSSMFSGCSAYNQALPANLNTAAVTNMSFMFYNCHAYNQALPANLNTAAVTDMNAMFANCSAYNQALPANLNTAAVTNMPSMFFSCSSYNQALPANLNTTAVTNMSFMFYNCSAYNQALPANLNTAAVTDMSGMFFGCSAYNQALPANLNTAAVTNMNFMFDGCSSFNQNIGNLNIAKATRMTNIFRNSGISRTNYDNILIAWNAAGYTNKNLGNASPLQYCAGQTARTSLTTTKGWTITGDTYNCPPPFVTRWNLATAGSGANQLSFGVETSGTVNYTWTTVPTGTSGAGTFTGTTATITGLPTGATIDLSILPTNFQRININSGTDKSRLTAINQWGDVVWTSMSNAFAGCNNMVLNSTDVPNTAAVTDMSYMFLGCSSFNQALPNGFNTAAVTNMSGMFQNCSAYNQSLPSSFNTAAVTDMSFMFRACSSFNQSLPSSFNPAAVTNMSGMFLGCSAFNQSLPSSFNTAAVTNMSGMFNNCSVFNQSLPSSFNTAAVTNMDGMFDRCSAFNQSLPSSFNTSAVTDMGYMFYEANKFNQNIGHLNIAAATTMTNIFYNSGISQTNYDAILTAWNTAGYTNKNLGNAAPLQYCAGAAARASLLAKGWSITNDAPAMPTAYNVTGSGAYCSGSTGAAVGLSNSETGVDYQLKNGATDVGTAVAGTGAAISFGNQNTSGTYTVVATRTTGGCTATMTGSAVVTVNSTPTASIAVINNCGNSVLNLTTSSLGVGGSFVWSNAMATEDITVSTSGSYTVTVTNSAACTATASGTAAPKTIPNATIAVTNNCGNSILDLSTTGTSFVWSNAATTEDVTISTSGTYTLTITNVAGCTATASQTITVFSGTTPTVYSMTGNGAIGTAIGLSNSAIGFSYQLKNGSSNVGSAVTGTDTAISFGNQNAEGTYTVVATNTTTGCTATMTGNVVVVLNPFITRWNLATAGSGATQLSFGVATSGTVNYTWTTVPAGTSGSGTFTGSTATITGLPAGATIELSILPTNFQRIAISNGIDKSRLTAIQQWGDVAWTSMNRAFDGCNNMVLNASDAPNTAAVTDMGYLFFGCSAFNQALPSSFNTAMVTSMTSMFQNCSAYNQVLPANFNTAAVTDMGSMFESCSAYNHALPSSFNTAKVEYMSSMFLGCSSFNQALPSSFNTAAVTNMSYMFFGCSAYNQALPNSFNTDKVTDMNGMFRGCSAFNQALPISFNTAAVTNMSGMFLGCSAYNQSLPSSFNTAAVTNMSGMFNNCSVFNQSLPSSFNTAAVTNMDGMFDRCSAFNQSLPSSFNTSAVTDMGYMFYEANKFNQNIGHLNIAAATTMTNIFYNSGISQTNYDAILTAWNTAGYTNKNLGDATPLQYCAGQTARTSLTTTRGWTITGDTYNCPPPFITRWNLATAGSGATQLSFGVETSGTVNYTWTTVPAGTSGAGTFTGTTATITGLPAGATIELSILPSNFQRFNMRYGSDRNRLTAIQQWGDVVWTSMNNAFAGCEKMELKATDVPNTAAVTDMRFMFFGCIAYNQALPANLNTAAVTDMSYMFYNCSSYNQALPANLNTAAVTDMSYMFYNCSSYNQALPANLNTAAVTNMSDMFRGCSAYNQALPANLNTAAVTDMSFMFRGCSAYNQALPANLNTAAVTNMSYMFYDCSAYNQALPANLNTAAVTNMIAMFYGCSAYNQALSANLNTAAVTNMSYMFYGCSAFNQNISNLNIAAATTMTNIFNNSGISRTNYDNILIAWNTAGYTNKNLGNASPLSYCAGQAAHTNLITNKGWLITGDAFTCSNIIYVNQTRPDNSGNGYSWATAKKDLQEAINIARSGNEIWVAGGTYKPTTSTDRNISFVMKEGVKIYGSFAGTEANLSERTPSVMATNIAILSGDIDGVADVITGSGSTLSITGNEGNSYHVILNDNNGLTTANSLIDGFTITGGNANGLNDYSGGGMANIYSSPSLINVTFTGNNATYHSGGMYNGGASIILNNVTFSKNNAGDGGGMSNANFDATSMFSHVTFTGNNATGNGGGLYNIGDDINVSHVTFCGNTAAEQGGGMFSEYASPILTNVTFSDNTAIDDGGGMSMLESSPSLSNVTFSRNSTSNQGGGLYAKGSELSLKNCIFGGNTKNGSNTVKGADIESGASTITTTMTVTNTLFQLANTDINYPKTGVEKFVFPDVSNLFAQDPLFVNAADPDGADNIFRTADDGLMLTVCSPAINAGNNADIPAGTTTDIVGNPRIFNTTVDMGAYEVQVNPNIPTITLSIVPPICVGATSFTLPYTATMGLPTTYSISGTGITTVTDGTLTATPITVNLSAAASSGIAIPFTLTVKNSSGCTSVNITGNSVTVNALPTLYTVTGGGSYCTGGTGADVGLSNSEIGVNYQLKNGTTDVGAAVAGTGAAISFGNQLAGTYTVEATKTTGGCTATMTGSVTNTITICVTGVLSGTKTICAGLNSTVSVAITGGIPPYSVVLNNGASDISIDNYISGTSIAVSPLLTTTYTLVSVKDASNANGSVSGTAVITVHTTLPAFIAATVPANVTVSCSSVPTAAAVTATSTCSTVTLNEVSTKGTDPAQCNFYTYMMTRTWTATDKRGNTATVSQLITVQDKTAPVITPAANVTVTEFSFAALPSTVPVIDCNATPTISFTDVKVVATPPSCYTYRNNITRTWTATDVCGNTATKTQFIVSQGIILTCPSDKTLNSNSDGVSNYNCSNTIKASDNIAPIFLDNCNASVLKYTLAGATMGNGNGSIAGLTLNSGVTKVTYALQVAQTDVCSFNLTIKDVEAPRFGTIMNSIVDACDFPNPITMTSLSTSDNCSGAITLTPSMDVTATVNACASKVAAQKYTKSVTRTWTATDAAGNSSTGVQRMYIRDMLAPNALCKDITVNISSSNITVLALQINNGSNDNCTVTSALSLAICRNISGACTFASSLSLSASLIPAGSNFINLPVSLRVTDACGNAGVCNATIRLQRATSLGKGNISSDLSTTSDTQAEIETSKPTIPSNIDATHGSLKCFPNPFSESLNLEYNLSKEVSKVTLKIYDNQGRLVTQSEQGEQLAGYYQINWNLSDLSAGMYHICLEIDGKCTKMERVLLLK
jgi:surface protein/predicted outer membrane repeat protein